MRTLMLNLLIKRFLMKNKHPLLVASVLLSILLCPSTWAVETASTPSNAAPAVAPATTAPVAPQAATVNTATTANPIAKPLTAEQLAKQKAAADAKVKALVKDQETRLQQLEKANLEALSQNQELQLKNDNLGVQVQVLQSERSAQMFLYGAATIAVGIFLGFLIASYIYTKRRRQW